MTPNIDAIGTENLDAGVKGDPTLVTKKIIELTGFVMILLGLVKLPCPLLKLLIATLYAKIVQADIVSKNRKFLNLLLPM
jgi:hypothetical protein